MSCSFERYMGVRSLGLVGRCESMVWFGCCDCSKIELLLYGDSFDV